MSRDLGHVADIVASAAAIKRYLADVGQDQFLTDDMRQSAILHQLTIVGEACRRVSPAFREAHPDVDWPGIIALRNRIVHDYDDVNLDSVWTVVSHDLPLLVATLEALVPAEPDGEEDR
jgi:uncharacterized protein with HEPN domain